MSDSYSLYGVARLGALPGGDCRAKQLAVGARFGVCGHLPALAVPRREASLKEVAPPRLALWGDDLVAQRRRRAHPEPLQGLRGVRNPFGLQGSPWVADDAYIVLPLLPLCILASAVSLVLRYRHSGGEQREQTK